MTYRSVNWLQKTGEQKPLRKASLKPKGVTDPTPRTSTGIPALISLSFFEVLTSHSMSSLLCVAILRLPPLFFSWPPLEVQSWQWIQQVLLPETKANKKISSILFWFCLWLFSRWITAVSHHFYAILNRNFKHTQQRERISNLPDRNKTRDIHTYIHTHTCIFCTSKLVGK